MKKFRSILTAFLALSLCMSLGACSKKEEIKNTEIDTSYDPADYVELCDYRNLKITDGEVEISDSDLTEYLRTQMDAYSETEEITDRGVQDGDLVSINIQGYVNGKPLDTLETYYYQLRVGDATLGKEFDDNLIGVTTGETKTFDIAYSEDYPSENLAGNTVIYEVKVNYILKYTEYDITDENVKNLSNGLYETVQDAKAAAGAYLLENDFTTYRNKYLLRKLVEGCTVSGYPEAQLAVYESDMISNFSSEAVTAGYDDFETYLDEIYGMTMEGFSDYVETYCKSALKEEMIYLLIAQKENIAVTDEEYSKYAQYYADAYAEMYFYSMTADEFAESLGQENLRQALTIRKTQDMIIQWNS